MAKKALVITVFVALLGMVAIVFGQNSDSSLAGFKNSYSEILVKYTSSRQEYLKAVNKYRSGCSDNQEECENLKTQAVAEAKDYLLSVYNLAISYSELSEERIREYGQAEKDNLLKTIEENKKWLAAKKEEISSKDSKEDIESSFAEIKGRWDDLEAYFTACRGYVFAWKIEGASRNVETFIAKVEAKIKDISKENGTSLKTRLEKVKSNLKNVKILVADIKDLSGKITKDNIAQFSLIDKKVDNTVSLLKSSLEESKNLLEDLRSKDYSTLEDVEKNALYVKGEGKIILNGSFNISGMIGDQNNKGSVILSVADQIDGVFGAGTKIGTDKIKYSDIASFTAKISKEAQIESDFIDVMVEGKGSALISGDGLYKKGEDGDWTDVPKQGLTVNLE